MTALDILILAIIAVGGVIGFSRGLLVQAGSIAALIVGVVAARLFGDSLAALWSSDTSAIDTAAGYGIAFLLGYGATWLVTRLMRKTVHTIHLGIIDSIAGAAFKVLQWGLILSLALNLYTLAAGHEAIEEAEGKPWRKATVDFAPAVLGYLADLNHHNVSDVTTPKSEKTNERK